MARIVAVLFAARKSVYKNLPDLDVYDSERNALTWPGGAPGLFHPPCRGWSVHCRHQSKPEAGELELGLWAADQLRRWGGILEQPAHSKLFEAANLPAAGEYSGDLWTIEVCQAWWGYPMLKKTWLCLCRIDRRDVQIQIRLHPHGGDRRREQLMSHSQRSETTLEFAKWLVETARKTKT